VAQGLNVVKVPVADVRGARGEADGGYEADRRRETSDRNSIRAILGMSTSWSNQPAGNPFPGSDGRDTDRKR
jgi:hypothetical protein